MSLKEAAANSLLMFVAATCVVLITKAITPEPQAAPAAAPAATSAQPVGSSPADAEAGAPKLAVSDGVKVYYLHGRIRCSTCRTIEEYAEEAVRTGFAAELDSGQIQWQAIDYDQPGQKHYALDYQVAAPTVVLARFQEGKQVTWKGLPEVWEHVGNKRAFVDFVQTSLQQFAGLPTGNRSPTPAELP
jgi:hypothetical protein